MSTASDRSTRRTGLSFLGLVLLLTGGCGDATTRIPGTGPGGCPGEYPDPAASPYVLPWRVGETWRVDQGNCGPGSHAPGSIVQYAYDFLMPISTPIVAARGGVVLLVEEAYADGTRVPGEENYINIVHDDGTIAGYVHLTRLGSQVAVGDTVVQGQEIGLSGDSGSSSQPHLHFHVQGCLGCPTVPVTFRNAGDNPRGLIAEQSYTAGPLRTASSVGR